MFEDVFNIIVNDFLFTFVEPSNRYYCLLEVLASFVAILLI